MYQADTIQTETTDFDFIESIGHTWPRIGELITDLYHDQAIETRMGRLRHIGAIWYSQGGSADILTELGLALAERLSLARGLVISELLLAYGATQEEQRTRDWETHLLNRVAELDGLHRIICAANSTLDLDASLQMVVETVAQVVGVEVCSIYLYEYHRNELVLRATHGLNQASVGQAVTRVGEGVTGWAAQLGAPVAVRDIFEDPRYMIEPQPGEQVFHSMLAVPIVLFSAGRFQYSADKLLGAISIQTRGPRDFTQEENNFVEVVAGELAFFITNAQLYQQTDDRLHQKVLELTTLQQVSKHIAEQIGLREVLNLIAEKAVDLSKANHADIFQLNDDGTLQLAASYGNNMRDKVHTFAVETVRTGQPLAVLNAYQDERFPELAQVAQHEGFHSIFCMPLRAREHTIGSICLYTNQPHHFDYDQVRLLSTFADEAAIAIENARLYDESQRALAVKSAMLQEMHHRVRNNLQTISALLAMQLRRLNSSSQDAQALRESVARIQSIAAVHNLLCREDVGVTTMAAVIRQVIESASTGLVSSEHPVQFDVLGDEVRVGSRDATVLALIINELISNALAHGLSTEGGCVEIEATINDDHVTVEVRDDGPRHPRPPESSSGHGGGLGLQIIETLVSDDMGGSFELVPGDEWMRARVRFPRRVMNGEPE
ncbi:MAG: GAF domain-containing protein [Chloroflexaceae bacterium]|nr:GAF domain-containing protein [Chloroflexaceae bacterium]